MEGNLQIYYDEEGDYLEIFVENSSPTYGEDMGEDVSVFKREGDGEIVGIGILNFKSRTKSLDDIKIDLPFKISFSSLKV